MVVVMVALARRRGVLSAGVFGRRVLVVGAVVLACGAGGAMARLGRSSAATPHLYWATATGTIVEANLNGRSARTIVKGHRQVAAVAVGGGHLYWSSATAHPKNVIVEANLNGTGAKTIATVPVGMLGVDLLGVAVGAGHLYWSDIGCTGTTSVVRCNGGGTIVEANLDGTGAKSIATHLPSPTGVAVGGGHLYWSELPGVIVEANLDGTGATTIASGQRSPWGVAVGGGRLYWVDSDFGNPRPAETIVQANLDGTGAVTVAKTVGRKVTYYVAVGGGHLYWSNLSTAGTIVEAKPDGTGAKTIATGQDRPTGLAVGP